MESVDFIRKQLNEASYYQTPKLITGRVCTPEVTFARIEPLLSVAGITRVADVTGLDTIGLPVVMVVRPNARSLAVSQGKGLNIIAAKLSGVMESLECFHAERISGPAQIGRLDDLAGKYDVIDPFVLPRLPTSRFRSEMSIAWIEALDLGSDQICLVPLEIVSTDFTNPGLPSNGFFGRSTNGLASGNTLHEALLHGLCEVIERDAWALWHASGGETGSAVDLANEADPRLVQLSEKFESAGCRVEIDDITTDIGVPVFFARLTKGGHGSLITEAPAGGLGCHPDRTLALLRALCEAAQSRLTRISGSRDDLVPYWYRNLDGLLESKPVKSEFRVSSQGVQNDTIEEDCAWVDERLTTCGMTERLVVNLTRDQFRLPVLKVIIPGLEAPPELGCTPGPRARKYLGRSKGENGT
jgi:YcaO-like protein with predicted kinase domain